MRRYRVAEKVFRTVGLKNLAKSLQQNKSDNLKTGFCFLATIFGITGGLSYLFNKEDKEKYEIYTSKMKSSPLNFRDTYNISNDGKVVFHLPKEKKYFDQSLKMKPVLVDGFFDHSKEIKVPIVKYGKIIGYKLFTPFYFDSVKTRYGIDDPLINYEGQPDYQYIEYGMPVYRGV